MIVILALHHRLLTTCDVTNEQEISGVTHVCGTSHGTCHVGVKLLLRLVRMTYNRSIYHKPTGRTHVYVYIHVYILRIFTFKCEKSTKTQLIRLCTEGRVKKR